MFKSTQIKIILIVIILAIIVFDGMGIIYIVNLNNLLDTVENKDFVIEQIGQVERALIIASGTFSIISIVIIIFSSKIIMNPLRKLIKSAKLIASGEENEIKIIEKDKSKTEIDDLIDAFNAMTTGLKDNLNEVTRQKKQIETLLLHMTDGLVAFNMDGKIIHINPAATRMLKISSKEQTFKEIFENLNVDINMEKEIYLEEWTTTVKKIEVDRKYVNLFFAPFKDENDRPAGIMALAQDVTEHVKLDNMRKEFVADVSHELKTPLTSILGYTETLLESEYDKDLQEKFLNVINSEAVRMTKLVSDLLTLSKYDNKNMQWEKTEFDLGELVKECEQNLHIEAERKNQKIECFVTAEVPPVYADRDGIERVVLNILSNSIKYTNEGGNIKIYVGFVYTDAYIKVIDNGIGIPEKDLSRIFERFYRVDKARTRTMGGTGLGLSIAKEILDNNEGRIDIKSEAKKGTEVVITIPTCQTKKNHI